jgi:hypothetical protein
VFAEAGNMAGIPMGEWRAELERRLDAEGERRAVRGTASWLLRHLRAAMN